MAGDPVITLDNVVEPIGGSYLCQLMTEHLVKIRPFGKLENIVVPSTTTFFATGNNITIRDDMTRRSLVCRIDPGVEQPEMEKFPFEPVELARRARGVLAPAVLTAVRSYLSSGERIHLPLGSYSKWTELVRAPLMWLGEDDPVKTLTKIRGGDPKLNQLQNFIAAWIMELDGRRDLRIKDLIELTSYDSDYSVARPELREVLLDISAGKVMDNVKIGHWLRANRDRIVTIDRDRYRVVLAANSTHGAKWNVERVMKVDEIDLFSRDR